MSNQSKGFFIACIGLLATISIHTGCGELRQKPNVVVLLVDTLRADHLKCYGYHRDTAPFLEGLARRGAVFTQCYAPSDYTPASTASLFTGQYPLAHGYLNSHYVLAETHTTIAEIFQRQGYTTAGFIANGLAGEKYQMDQGFDHYFEKNRASAAELVAEASAFIEQQADKPFFAYLHFLDVHDPHRIPQEYHGRFADPADFAYDMQDTLQLDNFVMKAWWEAAQGWRDRTVGSDQVATYFADYVQLYDASISYWDEQLGILLDLLAAQGIDEQTIIVVTSDHGEQFSRARLFWTRQFRLSGRPAHPLYYQRSTAPQHRRSASRQSGQCRRYPAHPAGPAQLADCSSRTGAGALVFARIRRAGRGLREHLYRGDFHGQPALQHLDPNLPGRGVEAAARSPAGYQGTLLLKEDPGELRDRFAERPEIAARLYGKIRQYYNGNLQLFERQQQSQMQLTEQKLQELRALGYITGRAGSQRPAQEFFP